MTFGYDSKTIEFIQTITNEINTLTGNVHALEQTLTTNANTLIDLYKTLPATTFKYPSKYYNLLTLKSQSYKNIIKSENISIKTIDPKNTPILENHKILKLIDNSYETNIQTSWTETKIDNKYELDALDEFIGNVSTNSYITKPTNNINNEKIKEILLSKIDELQQELATDQSDKENNSLEKFTTTITLLKNTEIDLQDSKQLYAYIKEANKEFITQINKVRQLLNLKQLLPIEYSLEQTILLIENSLKNYYNKKENLNNIHTDLEINIFENTIITPTQLNIKTLVKHILTELFKQYQTNSNSSAILELLSQYTHTHFILIPLTYTHNNPTNILALQKYKRSECKNIALIHLNKEQI